MSNNFLKAVSFFSEFVCVLGVTISAISVAPMVIIPTGVINIAYGCVGGGALLMIWSLFAENSLKQKINQEKKALEKARDEFRKMIKQRDYDLDDMKLVMNFFSTRVSELNKSWSELEPQEQNNHSVSVGSKDHLSFELVNLVNTYNDAIKEYPKTSAFKNLSTQEIYQQCNLFQAHHENVLGLCEYIAEKSAQDIARFEDAFSRAYHSQKMKK